MTKLVKLRLISQCLFSSDAGGWQTFKFSPADMTKPLRAMTFGATANKPYIGAIAGQWRDKTNTVGVIEINRQPQGLDEWLAPAGTAGFYSKYIVVGSQISITILDESRDPTATNELLYAGFTKLQDGDIDGQAFADNTGDALPTIGDKYERIDSSEVADWMNSGMCPRLKVVQSNPFGQGTSSARTFQFNYSQKKYAKHLRRIGAVDIQANFFTAHGNTPSIDPMVYFCIADLGTASAIVQLSAVIVIDYTVKLSGYNIGDASLL